MKRPKPGQKTSAGPKYRQIADVLLEEIRRTMGVGAKLPPESALAARFGVHVLTVREALRTLQAGGVIQRRRAVGTQVINPLAGSWVSIVCEMDVFSPNSGSLFHRNVIYRLRHLLHEAGLPSRVSVGATEPGQGSSAELTSLDFFSDIGAGRLAGVLSLATIPSDWWMSKLQKQGVPVVGSNHYFPYHVVFDPREDLSTALRCLLDHGRSRVAYIGWVERNASGPIDERLARALGELERGFSGTIHQEWIKGDIYPEKPGAGWEELREIWCSFKEKPDGLIIDNEHLLPDAERALTELRVNVPGDLTIICHRTRGNPYKPKFPVIIQENDPDLYATRMAEFFLRLYRGEKVASATVTVPRALIDDAMRGITPARP